MILRDVVTYILPLVKGQIHTHSVHRYPLGRLEPTRHRLQASFNYTFLIVMVQCSALSSLPRSRNCTFHLSFHAQGSLRPFLAWFCHGAGAACSAFGSLQRNPQMHILFVQHINHLQVQLQRSLLNPRASYCQCIFQTSPPCSTDVP